MMKKIAFTVLFVFLVASANANDFTNTVIDHSVEIAATTILTTIAASAYYYEIKYNDFKVLKKTKKLIQNNPKAAAAILAAITAISGLTADIALRGPYSLVIDFLDEIDRKNFNDILCATNKPVPVQQC